MLFIIRMTHTALTEPLEGEGYKFKQEDGRRPRPHVPSTPTHVALANFFFLLFFCSSFEGKMHSESQTTGTEQRIFKTRSVLG